MAEEVIYYYAIVDAFSSRRRPADVLRRTWRDGKRADEMFGRNLAWGHATDRYSVDSPDPAEGPVFALYEITRDEADRIVKHMLAAAAACN